MTEDSGSVFSGSVINGTVGRCVLPGTFFVDFFCHGFHGLLRIFTDGNLLYCYNIDLLNFFSVNPCFIRVRPWLKL